jgi:hypothetical protein
VKHNSCDAIHREKSVYATIVARDGKSSVPPSRFLRFSESFGIAKLRVILYYFDTEFELIIGVKAATNKEVDIAKLRTSMAHLHEYRHRP